MKLKLEKRALAAFSIKYKNHLLWKYIFKKYHPVAKEPFFAVQMERSKFHVQTNWGDDSLADLISKINGKIKVKDVEKLDFTDSSELKTMIISAWSENVRIEITNLRSKQGYKKVGALRLVVCNPFTSEIEFYYVPKADWDHWLLSESSTGRGRKFFYYNKKKKEFPQLKQYRVANFIDFCKITANSL